MSRGSTATCQSALPGLTKGERRGPSAKAATASRLLSRLLGGQQWPGRDDRANGEDAEGPEPSAGLVGVKRCRHRANQDGGEKSPQNHTAEGQGASSGLGRAQLPNPAHLPSIGDHQTGLTAKQKASGFGEAPLPSSGSHCPLLSPVQHRNMFHMGKENCCLEWTVSLRQQMVLVWVPGQRAEKGWGGE